MVFSLAACGSKKADTPASTAAPAAQDTKAEAKADDAASSQDTIEATDEEVPLTDAATKQSKMSWWWLLIVLLLGTTGMEMYRRHQKKLAETKNNH